MNKLRILCVPALMTSLLMGCAQTNAASTTTNTSQTITDGIKITFTDSAINTSSSSGIEVDGTNLTITQSGTYVLSGSCTNGSVKVKKGTTGVHIILNGLTLASQDTAPIVCAKSSEVTIEAAENTENAFSDTENNNDENGNTNAENAVIKCKDGSNVTLCGSGTLNIQANGKNGIKSGASTDTEGEASLTIQDLTLNIEASVNDAVNAENELNVLSGALTISSGDDALHSDMTLNIGKDGSDGPTITITDCNEGLEGATVNVYSGNIDIVSTDDCINGANADLTDYAYQINISGGTITAYSSAGDGFDSNGDLTISGGNVTVWTANAADNEPLDADGTLSVSGGTVLAAGGSSGMGVNLEATQPCVVYSNAGTMDMQDVPTNDGKQFDGSQAPEMNGEKPSDDQQMDEKQPPEMDGKDVAQTPQGNPGGMQKVMLSEGSSFTITDSDGNVLYEGNAVCNASYVFFSSSDITSDTTYTLTSGDATVDSEGQSGTITSGMGGGAPMNQPGKKEEKSV